MAAEIWHYGAITLRVNGTGNLLFRFAGLDEVSTESPIQLAMADSPGRMPTRLANFNGQKAVLRLRTTEINEFVKINRIIVWVKPMWTSYPM